MLAEISAQLHERYRLRRFLSQRCANRFALIRGTVVHQDNLEVGRPKNRVDALDHGADGLAAVVNGNHQR